MTPEDMAYALMAAPDPVRAIASEIGDLHGRIDSFQDRLNAVEARISYVAEAMR